MEILLIEVFTLKREGTLLIVFSLLSMHLQVSHPHRKDWIQPHLLRHSSSGITRGLMHAPRPWPKNLPSRKVPSQPFPKSLSQPMVVQQLRPKSNYLKASSING